MDETNQVVLSKCLAVPVSVGLLFSREKRTGGDHVYFSICERRNDSLHVSKVH